MEAYIRICGAADWVGHRPDSVFVAYLDVAKRPREHIPGPSAVDSEACTSRKLRKGAIGDAVCALSPEHMQDHVLVSCAADVFELNCGVRVRPNEIPGEKLPLHPAAFDADAPRAGDDDPSLQSLEQFGALRYVCSAHFAVSVRLGVLHLPNEAVSLDDTERDGRGGSNRRRRDFSGLLEGHTAAGKARAGYSGDFHLYGPLERLHGSTNLPLRPRKTNACPRPLGVSGSIYDGLAPIDGRINRRDASATHTILRGTEILYTGSGYFWGEGINLAAQTNLNWIR